MLIYSEPQEDFLLLFEAEAGGVDFAAACFGAVLADAPDDCWEAESAAGCFVAALVGAFADGSFPCSLFKSRSACAFGAFPRE